MFGGYGDTAANDDQCGSELFNFRGTVINHRERSSAGRLHDDPVVGKEFLAGRHSGPI